MADNFSKPISLKKRLKINVKHTEYITETQRIIYNPTCKDMLDTELLILKLENKYLNELIEQEKNGRYK